MPDDMDFGRVEKLETGGSWRCDRLAVLGNSDFDGVSLRAVLIRLMMKALKPVG